MTYASIITLFFYEPNFFYNFFPFSSDFCFQSIHLTLFCTPVYFTSLYPKTIVLFNILGLILLCLIRVIIYNLIIKVIMNLGQRYESRTETLFKPASRSSPRPVPRDSHRASPRGSHRASPRPAPRASPRPAPRASPRPAPRTHPMPRRVPDVFTALEPRRPDATFEIHGFDGYEADTEE